MRCEVETATAKTTGYVRCKADAEYVDPRWGRRSCEEHRSPRDLKINKGEVNEGDAGKDSEAEERNDATSEGTRESNQELEPNL